MDMTIIIILIILLLVVVGFFLWRYFNNKTKNLKFNARLSDALTNYHSNYGKGNDSQFYKSIPSIRKTYDNTWANFDRNGYQNYERNQLSTPELEPINESTIYNRDNGNLYLPNENNNFGYGNIEIDEYSLNHPLEIKNKRYHNNLDTIGLRNNQPRDIKYNDYYEYQHQHEQYLDENQQEEFEEMYPNDLENQMKINETSKLYNLPTNLNRQNLSGGGDSGYLNYSPKYEKNIPNRNKMNTLLSSIGNNDVLREADKHIIGYSNQNNTYNQDVNYNHNPNYINPDRQMQKLIESGANAALYQNSKRSRNNF